MLFKHSLLLAIISFIFTPSASSAASVNVFAAASMTQPISEIALAFEDQTNLKVTLVFAASSTLARQIARGAPADVFISANDRWLQYLVSQRKVHDDSITNLVGNRLVIAAPVTSDIAPFDLSSKIDLTQIIQNGRIAIGNTDHVPVGIYTKQSLVNLHLWQSVKSHLAQASNTRTALAFIERKAVPIGIVYKTDALSSAKVKIIATFPASSHTEIQYPLALVHNTTIPKKQAKLFYAYLQSPVAREIFQRYGFITKKNVN
jgi:molybdate transport system substrate-binding protein